MTADRSVLGTFGGQSGLLERGEDEQERQRRPTADSRVRILTVARFTVKIWAMDTENRYSLADLARVSGVSPRTVRYYIAQGLLPGANDPGPAAWYDDRHLARLRLARELQRQHLPLAEIRARLAALTDDEVAEAAAAESSRPAVRESALDYVRSILGGPTPTPTRPHMASLARSPSLASTSVYRMATPSASEPAPSPPASSEPARSQWDRIAITPDIELHVRRPLGRHDNKLVERLLVIARQVLKEEQP